MLMLQGKPARGNNKYEKTLINHQDATTFNKLGAWSRGMILL